MASDDELKDEELVDFEGSDYDIDGDYEEVEEEEEDEEEKEKEAVAHQLPDLPQGEHHDCPEEKTSSLSTHGVSETLRSLKSTGTSALEGIDHIKSSALGAVDGLTEVKRGDVESAEALELVQEDANRSIQNEEAIGSIIAGTIHADKASGIESTHVDSSCIRNLDNGGRSMEITGNHRDGNDISGPVPNICIEASGAHFELELVEVTPRLVPSSKPDLEDGELDETTVPQNYSLTAEEEFNDQTSGREKKRRLEASGMGRHLDGFSIKQLEETEDLAEKQHHYFGSDKAMEHLAGLTFAGGRGIGLRMIGLGQGSLAPGIMGPGRPGMPFGIGSLAQGFNPFGGITQHGRPHVHLQDVLAQEHLLRAHALQLAQETLANAIRSPLTRPLGGAVFQPFIGFDVPGPRSHASKHFLRPIPDMAMGPLGSFARGQRPHLPVGRAGVPGKVAGQADTSLYNGMGRHFGWPAASGSNEALKRERERSRGFRTSLWGDIAESFGPIPGGLGPAGHPRAMTNFAAPLSIRRLIPDETFFYPTSTGSLQAENDLLRNGFDARWKIEKERMLRNGFPNLQTSDTSMVEVNPTDGDRDSVKDSEKDGETKLPHSQDRFKTGSLAARLGPPAQDKVSTSTKPNSAEVVVTSNVIKLHEPVRKSRILIVSGLPEDTPISTVVEVFEKLGKITDFKKSPKGDVFTISYSSEREAVSAKRNLHRSCLAGKQITVDYAHQ